MSEVLQFIKNLFMLKFFPELGHDASFGLLFLLGVLTSFHCIAMCGGIAISQTIGNKRNSADKERGRYAWLLPSALYNLGRTVSYTLVGGIVGGLGQVISFTGFWKGVIPIIGGLFMVIMGINLLGIFAPLRRLNIRMPYFAAKKMKEKNNYGPFYIGALSGLMPCGPLQIVQLYALGTQSIFFGALSMLVFSLGTIPVLFAFGAIHSIINKKYANRILKLSAVFVIILGVVMVERGLTLSNLYVSVPGSSANAPGVAHVEKNLQTITTAIKSDSYSPIVVQKGIPVQWTIHAEEENLNECNNEITIPKYKIEKKLQEGDNLIEFTPQETGDFVYTCWMGMIKSKITVVDDIRSFAPEAAVETAQQKESFTMACRVEPQKTEASDEPVKPEQSPSLKAQDNKEDKEVVQEEAKTQEPQPVKAAVAVSPSPKPTPVPSQSPAPKAAPAKPEDTVLTGYLIDKHCFGLVTPGKETRTCLTMEECESSGYGIAVKQEDGQFKFYLFDANGHQLSKDFLSQTKRNSGFSIRVTGRPEGETFKVTAFAESEQ